MDKPVCRYCGANALPREHNCQPRVIFIPSTGRVWDFVGPDNLTHFGRRTLEDVQAKEGADAVILPLQEATKLYEAAFIKPLSEVTREKFWDALEVLPPVRWQNNGSEETFFVSERIAGRVVQWFARYGERYFTMADLETLTHFDVMLQVTQYMHRELANATRH